MIDLIIPYYNNPDGLRRTLNSINKNIFYVTVVDDGSKYTPHIKEIDQVLRYKDNRGPGMARQFGINHTKNPWIMFIDTGDVFLSKEIQEEIAHAIEEDTVPDIYFWTYYYKEKITTLTDNRLHGKVYKRSFLEKYNITFSKAGSYLDEDIGFNRTCRILAKYSIKFMNKPVIQWIREENSLTQKDNSRSSYEKQTRALSINSIHCITTCRKNNVNEALIKQEIHEIAASLYYWFIRTAAERPEFIEQAWEGAKIFYNRYKDEINSSELAIGNTRLIRCMPYREKIHFPLNVIRFTRDINTYTHLPQWYK